MPWHAENNPWTDNDKHIVRVGDTVLPHKSSDDSKIVISNLSVKKFHSLLQKKRKQSEDFADFQLAIISASYDESRVNDEQKDPEIALLKQEFSNAFRSDLPAGLSPEGEIDHKI